MTGNTDDALVRAWQEHRPYLLDLAFRMLSDIGAAEDVVQDAFIRFLAQPAGQVHDARGWLIVVTSRLCLDQLKSARSQREWPVDAAEIDAGAARGRPRPGDPADRVTLDDSVRLALFVLLERLTPAERVSFVLHDVFQLPYDVIAETVGRPVATCRQLAHRARQKITEGRAAARFPIDPDQHREVTARFIAYCTTGDLQGLLQVLAPDVWGDVDRGPDALAAEVFVGAERVAGNLIRFWQQASLVSYPVDGRPAVLAFRDRRLAAVLMLTLDDDGRIQAIHVIADPPVVAEIERHLTARG